MTDRPCLHCVHWDGSERDVAQQFPARCTAHRTATYADETCALFVDATVRIERVRVKDRKVA